MTEVSQSASPVAIPQGGWITPASHGPDSESCLRFQEVIELVGKRWSASILLAATRGAERFGEYRDLVTGISERLLSERLKELEHFQLIERTETAPATGPVQIRYTLTPRGEDLIRQLEPLMEWGNRWA